MDDEEAELRREIERELNDGAGTIQGLARGWKARKDVAALLLRTASVVVIQVQ